MNRQLSLFDNDNKKVAYIAGFASFICAAMNRAAATSPYSRQQIVDRMNRLSQAAGKRLTQGNAKSISLDTLEKWLNPESGQNPGLLATEVFMQAVETIEPIESWLGLHGCDVMSPKDKKLRDLGEKKLRQKRVAEEVRQLEQQLQEVVR